MNSTTEICSIYETYTAVRFVYIVVAGLMSIAGVVLNALLIVIFSNRSCATTPPTLYPSALALLDLIICACYTLLFGMDAIISYMRIESLFVLYYSYLIPAYTLARIAQLSIPYMLIFATLERLVWISERRKNNLLRRVYSREGRYTCVAVTLLVCVAVRLPTFWALKVREYPFCPDFFRSLTTEPTEWAEQTEWYHIFDFHILTVAQTFVPFFVLVIFNVIIVRKLRAVSADYSDPTVLEVAPLQHMMKPRSTHSQVRSAILTMVAIVVSYLICNSLQLVLTLLEKSDSELLRDPEDPEKSSLFHTTFSDLISFVYMFTSAIRLFIYAGCSTEIRKDIIAVFSSKPRPSLI